MAISDRNTTMSFAIAKYATQGKLIQDAAEEGAISVQSTTLDAFIDAGNRLPGFIKMDIEGAEGDALAGYSGNIIHPSNS